MTNAGRIYRLLIVDDDETDRRLYGQLLSARSPEAYEVRWAANGAAGLAALRVETPDCVLLAFDLPDMTGWQFLADAAVDGALPCAIVLVTDQGAEAIAVEALKRGVHDHLMKDTVDEGRLYRAVAGAVAQTQLRQCLAGSLRDLTAANSALEQQIVTHKATEAALRTAKERAEQANQTTTRFVARVIHALRMPLNDIQGHAERLRKEGGLSTQQYGHVTAMMQAGSQLRKMIDRALDFACIETGKMEMHPVAIPVHDLIKGCIASTGRRVLLVDDIAMNRDVIGSFLSAAGHEVLLATDGREAVRLASEQVLDLILMDVSMPEMDGLEATRLIRALPREHGRVPILALTAYTFGHQVAQCRDAGMDGHIAKPVNYGTLARAIEATVARAPPKWPLDGATEAVAIKAERLPLLDREILDETFTFLSSSDITSKLGALRDHMEHMVLLLDQRAAMPLLTEAAHTLASIVGMFGFVALSSTTRRFRAAAAAERAPEATELGHRMRQELLASLSALDELASDRQALLTTAPA
jgi:CheY-like chemotaxis protein